MGDNEPKSGQDTEKHVLRKSIQCFRRRLDEETQPKKGDGPPKKPPPPGPRLSLNKYEAEDVEPES